MQAVCGDAERTGLPRPTGVHYLTIRTSPRQVGLAGSSAIVTAAVKALMRFYDIGGEIPKASYQPHPQR